MHATPHAHSPGPDCAAFLATLDAVVDGEADALAAARSEAHAARCAACAQRLRSARRYRARLLQAGRDEAAPATLRERVLDLLHGLRGSRTR